MTRKSVNELRSQDVAGAMTDCRNDVAETFLDEIEKIFGERILPTKDGREFGVKFAPEEAPLYVQRRKWASEGREPQKEYNHEEYLHRYYWPAHNHDHPLLIIQGPEGVGKSTLVRYYFDCYLPHYDHFPYVDEDKWDSQAWQRELGRHLVLYVNLRVGPATGVEDHIFWSFDRQINKQHPAIEVENEYAMWQRIADWHKPRHADAERNFPDRAAYRADYVNRFSRKEAVEETLWYLARQQEKDGTRKHYVTLIFDNLDQQDKHVQKNVLQMVLAWLGPMVNRAPDPDAIPEDCICLWKVILPLRPETFRSLYRDLQPVNRKDIIELSAVKEELLRSRRIDGLKQAAGDTKKQVERGLVFKETQIPVYLPLLNATAVQMLEKMLNYDFMSLDAGGGRHLGTRQLTQGLVEKFCNDSIRRYLRLRRRLAMSVSIERTVSRGLEHPPKEMYIPHYVFLDGWLTGGRDHFHKDDPDNDVLNLYDTTTRGPRSAHTLLIGPHVLFLLRRNHYSRDQLMRVLAGIGYHRSEVEDCLNAMRARSLIRYGDLDVSGDPAIETERDILEAHHDLLTHPAYTDNMAIVTPVEESYRVTSRGQPIMRHTVSYELDQFRDRVTTTFSFLRQIREDEATVSKWDEDSSRHSMEAREFKRSFNLLGLPSVYRKVAVKYRERLEQLRGAPRGLKEIVSPSDWDVLLNDDILSVTPNQANTPLKAVGP